MYVFNELWVKELNEQQLSMDDDVSLTFNELSAIANKNSSFLIILFAIIIANVY